ncbi:MAG: 4Fe-4S binding protein [bacterium]
MSLFHKIAAEGSPLQRYTLYMLARRLEIPFLKISFNLLRGRWKRIGNLGLTRALFAAAVTRPIARHGDAARPVPYEALIAHIDSIEGAIAVGPCRCRITHKSCGHPLETDIVIRTGAEAWLKAFPNEYRVIDKNEAKRIVGDCHALGMFHMIFFHCPTTGCAEYVICNCCLDGCVPYIINRELVQRNFPFLNAEWLAVTDMEKCSGRADCVSACPFGARSVVDGKAVTSGCFGCGLCVAACPEKAISMKHNH